MIVRLAEIFKRRPRRFRVTGGVSMSSLNVRENRSTTRPDERPRPCRGSEQVAIELTAPDAPPWNLRFPGGRGNRSILRAGEGDPLSCIIYFSRTP
jgi:hypothetical protein